MNNNFKKYIKSAEKKVDKSTLFIGLFAGIFAALNLSGFSLIIVFPLMIIIIAVYFVITAKKENKKIIDYDLGMDIDNNIYIPLTYNDVYLKEIDFVLDNDDVLDKCKNLIDYIQIEIEEKNIVFLERDFDLKETIFLLNELLKHKKKNYKLKYDDIVKDDDEVIKKRRKDNVSTALYDLAKIRYYLERNGLELVNFYAPSTELSKKARIDGFLLTIVEIEKVEELYKLKYKNMIN